MKIYGKIKNLRLLNVKVIDNDNQNTIFEGKIENIPEEIGEMRYSKIVMGNPVILYIYNKSL